MNKKIGNIEVEVQDATNCGQPFLVYLAVRTSTVKSIILLPDDARDMVYGLQWALGLSKGKNEGQK